MFFCLVFRFFAVEADAQAGANVESLVVGGDLFGLNIERLTGLAEAFLPYFAFGFDVGSNLDFASVSKREEA